MALIGAAACCDAHVMSGQSGIETIERVGSAATAVAADGLWRVLEPLRTTAPACCCCAHPVVRVVMPVADTERAPTELLLCGHHFRASRAALASAGAVAFDTDGALVRLIA